MLKAKYIGKYIENHGNDIFLEYEYRGMKYRVHESRTKGNEPLSWQHRSEQDLIDRILDTKCNATEDARIGLDFFFSEEYENLC